MESDKQIAFRILCSLCESSFVDDMQDYKNYIQNDLQLSNEQMDRIYNLKTIIKLILPERHYKGSKLFDLESVIRKNDLSPLSPLTDDEQSVKDF